MKRSEFLKRLGLGIVAIPLAPKIAAEVAESLPTEEILPGKIVHLDGGIDFLDLNDTPKEYYPPMRESTIHEELYKRYGGRDIREVMEIYRETGDLIYSSNSRMK